MKKSLKYRETVSESRRVVVKIGSRVLVQATGRPDLRRMRSLAGELAAIQKAGYQIVVVTSGAIAAGMEALGMKKRPQNLPDLQMAAAVGQARLISRYADLFGKSGCMVGQVLMTHANFHHKIQLTNARRTMENMIRRGVIPVVNENDVVADEEIKADLALGDNDMLASLVVKLIRADLLVVLTTADGLRKPSGNGRTQRVRYLESVDKSAFGLVTGGRSSVSKGGMTSKLKAAQTVSRTGCSVIIADGRKANVLRDVMNGRDVGTMILASAL